MSAEYHLIYCYDALCGWCFGFAPHLARFCAAHPEVGRVSVLSGGMVTGERVGPIGEVAGYIRWAYKEVEDKAGIRFGRGFLENVLEDGKAIFTSLPPALALSAFKAHLPDQSLSFAERLQQAVYADGIQPAEFEAYRPLAEEFGLDGAAFLQQMHQEATAREAAKDFQLCGQLGVKGFPSVFLADDERIAPLCQGFLPFENLEKQYQIIMKQMR